jgi:hypothetical protein
LWDGAGFRHQPITHISEDRQTGARVHYPANAVEGRKQHIQTDMRKVFSILGAEGAASSEIQTAGVDHPASTRERITPEKLLLAIRLIYAVSRPPGRHNV